MSFGWGGSFGTYFWVGTGRGLHGSCAGLHGPGPSRVCKEFGPGISK